MMPVMALIESPMISRLIRSSICRVSTGFFFLRELRQVFFFTGERGLRLTGVLGVVGATGLSVETGLFVAFGLGVAAGLVGADFCCVRGFFIEKAGLLF